MCARMEFLLIYLTVATHRVYSVLGVTFNKVDLENLHDEGCYLDEKTERIQVAYVIDNTWTNKGFIERLRETIQTTVTRLNSLHPGTECAITTHANYPDEAWRRKRGVSYTGPEDCYVVYRKFTTNIRALEKASNKVEFVPRKPNGFPEENAVTALAFCSADNKIGWVRGIRDKAGKRVHRFMVLMTDQYSRLELAKPGDRTPFRGDGSDTCRTSKMADLDDLREMLERYDIYIVGAYIKHQKTHQKYVDEFKKARISHRHCHGEKAMIDEDEFASEIADLVHDCVQQLLRCTYSDPPSYNTLGL